MDYIFHFYLFNGHFLFRKHSFNRISRTETYLNTLPQNHQLLLKTYREHLCNIHNCIEQNYNVIKLILKDVGYLFENINPEETNPRTVSIQTDPHKKF